MAIVSPCVEVEHAAACTSLLQTCKELKPAPIQTARAALETVRSEALAVFTVVAVAERGLADAAAEADRLAKLTDAARQARDFNCILQNGRSEFVRGIVIIKLSHSLHT